MKPDEKKELYETYLSDRGKQIKVQIPNGPLLNWNKCWNYVANLTEVSFNTLTKPEIEHPLMKVEEIDLHPVAFMTYWHVKILKQALPEIKADHHINKGKNHAHDSY